MLGYAAKFSNSTIIPDLSCEALAKEDQKKEKTFKNP
jgi:hypothetical protein